MPAAAERVLARRSGKLSRSGIREAEGYRQGRLAAEQEQAIPSSICAAADHQLEELQLAAARCLTLFWMISSNSRCRSPKKFSDWNFPAMTAIFVIMNEAMSRFKQGEKTTVKAAKTILAFVVSSVYARRDVPTKSLFCRYDAGDGSLIMIRSVIPMPAYRSARQNPRCAADVSTENPAGEEDAHEPVCRSTLRCTLERN
jgi:hypothetical protein